MDKAVAFKDNKALNICTASQIISDDDCKN